MGVGAAPRTDVRELRRGAEVPWPTVLVQAPADATFHATKVQLNLRATTLALLEAVHVVELLVPAVPGSACVENEASSLVHAHERRCGAWALVYDS